MRRIGAKFPPQIPVNVSLAVDVGITTEQLLAEKEQSLAEAATKNDELDKQNARLRAKVDRLERELDFTSKDRYELVRKTCTLQNRLGDFQSWPQFREEYDLLVTEYGMMQRQREREDISHQQMLHIAKDAKLKLASVNRAAAMSKIAHSEELTLLKRERDDARENYETLVTTTNTAAATATTATKGNTPGDKVLQEENTRLTLALRSQTSLLAKKTSEFERMQSLLKSRSNHSASQLSEAASTILSLGEEKKKGDNRIAELEKDLTEAKEKAEEMEEMYLAVAFADMGKGEEDEDEDEDDDDQDNEDDDDGDDEDDDNDEDDEDGEGGENEEEEGDEGEEKRIHDENEDLFKDMMGSP